MYSLGLDFGSASVKGVLLGQDGRLVASFIQPRAGGTMLESFRVRIEPCIPDSNVHFCVTGACGQGPGRAVVPRVNAILALARGARQWTPGVRNLIEVGGQTAKFLRLEADGSLRDFATNEACAAGTGAFLEQQARRLGLSAAELGGLAAQAGRAATIAGRCSVFAASDMIHLQQKGTPLAEIAYGLCLAIARNVLSTLVKDREDVLPILIAGGCARNPGLLRAFRSLLEKGDPGAVSASAEPGLEAAFGAALTAFDQPGQSVAGLPAVIASLQSEATPLDQGQPPLRCAHGAATLAEPEAGATGPLEGFLGIDVGSVSTDLVLLDPDGQVLSSIYLPTQGRPVEQIMAGLSTLSTRFGPGLRVLGCGTTGSGRHLAGKLVGADVVKNEITCQLLGARQFVPEVDTILEIGGQDSKFIRVRDGAMADFAMNKVCAAGTGSFLEEQARDLGIDVHGQFSDCAFAGSAPLDLGSRCTVFMETEVVAAQARGGSVENLCAGLAYSIARNYLDKVVGHRALGRNIVFQGGVASNTAVVAAFEAILGTSVQVHPYNRISGAIGAALAARMARPAQTRFKGLTQATVPRLTCFECQQCSNRCEVNVIETGEGERAFFGDTCERYTSGPANRVCTVPDLAGEYLEHCEALFASAPSCGLRIGVPRASSLMGDLPFWASFWGQLGHQPVLSPPSSAETLATGLKHLSVGVCLPIKLLAGHVHALLEQDVDMVFLPASMDLAGADPEHAHACPYTMAAPFIVGATDGERCLTPVLRFHSEDAFVDAFEPVRSRIGAQREQIRSAFRIAVQVQLETLTAFRTRTRELLDARGYSHAFAILARPYSTLDRFVNLALFERLRRLNVLAIPMAFLPRTEPASVGAELPWHYPEEICRAGRALDATPRIDPVVLSSYGCGPDAFTLQRLAEILGGRPYLVLELDEHRGDAGMMTRVEAFLDQLQAVPTSHTHRPERVPSSNWVPRDPAVIWIPRFADHAYAYSGLLRHLGHDPRVLPLPDREAQALGERHALGKECHPYSMILGDLLQLAGRPDTRDSVFFFPGTSIPCLLHEYGSGMQTLLRDLGIRHIRVSSPTGASLMEAVGLKPLERFYTGLLAIELLVKAVCQTRPYERNRGETDRVHQENLDRIETAIAGGDVLKALGQSLRDLGGITTDPTRDRPKVGLVGDLYTRVNPAANQELVRWFEDEGLEVWPSPFQIDLVDHGISRNFYESLTTLGLPNLVANGSIALLRAIDLWRVRNVVGSRISHRDEPGLLQARRLAAPYMPNEDHELLFLQVAKTADFARSGVNGVVNAICFGCMVGNAAAALNERIRRDHDHLPILTAVYSGGGSPARTMALEAFVSQVKAHHRRAART